MGSLQVARVLERRRGRGSYHRREGFSVFVDNVSKRIHHSALREAFGSYGKVVDVFVAYKNMKRRLKPTTFALVRYNMKSEAVRAMKESSGRLMDGFRIRVVEASTNSRVGPQPKSTVKKVEKKVQWALKDSRSFRDVLMGIKAGGTKDSMEVRSSIPATEDATTVLVEECNPDPDGKARWECKSAIIIRDADMEWRKRSLVGQIKSMYNVDIMQEGLCSDGLNVEVCPWYGLQVILRFPSSEDCQACWRRRSELVELWFDELKMLEGFEGKEIMKLWVKILDVPLKIWNKAFFEGIGSRWGEVLKIEDDTLNLRRFDEAKILVRVLSPAVIPKRMQVVVNGIVYRLRIQSELYEEEAVFIDGRPPGGAGDDRVDDASYPENEFNWDDQFPMHNSAVFPVDMDGTNTKVDDALNSTQGSVDSKRSEQQSVSNGPTLFEVPITSDNIGAGTASPKSLGSNPPQRTGLNRECHFFGPTTQEAPLHQAEDLCQSLGPTFQDVPIFQVEELCQPVSSSDSLHKTHSRGRPCVLESINGAREVGLRAGLDKFQWWIRHSAKKPCTNQRSEKKSKKKSEGLLSIEPRHIRILGSPEEGENMDKNLAEATPTFNLGDKMGIAFNDAKKNVISRLVELEVELGEEK
ncbi:hypothetical protein HRI_003299300 [Hibiscus trionum]|uniref:RRM domain-containing protein n=1 Tax=Hibiscus trionum TaxID=183268 RepID=A0A9W7IHG2_HIBTR|nr:hypothetical protein HRI_003299300 [Hibiscus trionum]